MALNPINLSFLNSLNRNYNRIQASAEKLASGNDLIRSEKPSERGRADILESELRSERVAARNAADAKSFMQIAEGGLNGISNQLMRLKELTLQATNAWVGYDEREILNQEADQIKKEIERIALTTHYKNNYLLNGEGKDYSFQVGAQNIEANRIGFSTAPFDVRASSLGVDDVDLSSAESALDSVTVLDEALLKVETPKAIAGSFQNRLESIERQSQNVDEVYSGQLSRLRDTDVAKEATELLKYRILQDAGISVIAQTNNMQRGLLRLLEV